MAALAKKFIRNKGNLKGFFLQSTKKPVIVAYLMDLNGISCLMYYSGQAKPEQL